MTTETTGLGIHKAINAIKERLARGGGIGKDGKAMGYAFRGIEALDHILCGMTAEHGIVMYPRVTQRDVIHGTTAKGGYNCHVFLHVDWTFVCAADGSRETVTTVGEAMDTQDKSANKAMQASRKYAMTMVYMIPVAGDDTETYAPDPQPGVERTGPGEFTVTVPPDGNGITGPVEIPKRTRGPNKPKDAPLPTGNLLPAQQTQAEPVPTGYAQVSAGGKTIDVPAEVTHPSAVLGEMPFPAPVPQQNGAAGLVTRVNGTNTFAILYAFAQEADKHYPAGHPDRNFVFGAIKGRAIGLFAGATDMKGVQEGFELVTALGQPDDLKQAANAAYGKFRK